MLGLGTNLMIINTPDFVLIKYKPDVIIPFAKHHNVSIYVLGNTLFDDMSLISISLKLSKWLYLSWNSFKRAINSIQPD